MRICIFGAGSIGGHLAARIARVGEDFIVIARGPHFEALQSSRTRCIRRDLDFAARLHATIDPATLGRLDAVTVAVKGPPYQRQRRAPSCCSAQTPQ